MSERTKTKTVGESRLEINSLMRPQHANFAGNVHGGAEASFALYRDFPDKVRTELGANHD